MLVTTATHNSSDEFFKCANCATCSIEHELCLALGHTSSRALPSCSKWWLTRFVYGAATYEDWPVCYDSSPFPIHTGLHYIVQFLVKETSRDWNRPWHSRYNAGLTDSRLTLCYPKNIFHYIPTMSTPMSTTSRSGAPDPSTNGIVVLQGFLQYFCQGEPQRSSCLCPNFDSGCEPVGIVFNQVGCQRSQNRETGLLTSPRHWNIGRGRKTIPDTCDLS